MRLQINWLDLIRRVKINNSLWISNLIWFEHFNIINRIASGILDYFDDIRYKFLISNASSWEDMLPYHIWYRKVVDITVFDVRGIAEVYFMSKTYVAHSIQIIIGIQFYEQTYRILLVEAHDNFRFVKPFYETNHSFEIYSNIQYISSISKISYSFHTYKSRKLRLNSATIWGSMHIGKKKYKIYVFTRCLNLIKAIH